MYVFGEEEGTEGRKSDGNCPIHTSYQSAFSWEFVEGVSVAGNINTLACMNVKSGRLAITLMASSLRCSSFFGFLVDVLVFSTVDMSLAKASVTLRLEVETSSLEVVNSYNSGSTPGIGQKNMCSFLVTWWLSDQWKRFFLQQIVVSMVPWWVLAYPILLHTWAL